MHRNLFHAMLLGTAFATVFAAAPVASAGGPGKDKSAKKEGHLDKDIIRTVVRSHIGDIRSCYNMGLKENDRLAGKVVTQFVIDPEGEINHAEVLETTLDHEEVEECMIGAIAHWKFPKPRGGGNVVITYPFVLEPG